MAGDVRWKRDHFAARTQQMFGPLNKEPPPVDQASQVVGYRST
jgi:hypothetical protein